MSPRGLRFRKRIRMLPFLYANLSRAGLSWSVKLGPWSYNTRQRRQHVDLPGPIYYDGRRQP